MKEFEVGFWYTEYGTTKVEAPTKEEAEAIVFEQLQKNGLDEIKYKTNDRDYDTEIAMEIK